MAMTTQRARNSSHQAAGKARGPFYSPIFWALPAVVVMVLAVLGTALYLGGLSNPAGHLKDFPVAIVNQDRGADVPSDGGGTEQQNYGQRIEDEFATEAGQDERLDLRQLTWDGAREQLERGELFAVVVIPESFSEDTVSMVKGSLTQESAAQPEITLYTDPQAGSLGTRVATEVVQPGLDEASSGMGESLVKSAESAQQQAYDQVLSELESQQDQQSEQLQRSAARGGPAVQQFAQQVQQAQADTPQQVADQLAPKVSSVSTDLLRDPLNVVTQPYQELEEGTALGMGAFYYAIILLVIGLSGSIAVNVLMDARAGMAPLEMGPSFRDLPRVSLPRWLTFLIKWGLFTVAAAPTSALMLWVASGVGMPVPHGVALFFAGWLSLSAVSAVVLALITLGGSAGMLLSMIYLVFMGLPSAGAVVPLQAVPDFFRVIAPLEPLHHIYMMVRSILYFDAHADAGLQSGVIGVSLVLIIAVLVALAGGCVYDRKFGRRGSRGSGKHAAHRVQSPATDAAAAAAVTGGQPAVKSGENPNAVLS